MKIWIRRIITVALIIAIVLSLQKLVVPKYTSGVIEGTFTREFYDEKYNHQVLMIGDCEVYENISPITLWRNYGITSYLRGNAQQLAWHGYYMLKEALEMGEKPDVVVFSVLALKYNAPQKEEYNRLIFDYMKPSLTKFQALQASMMPDTVDEITDEPVEREHYLDYIFPILRYHSRIGELSQDDVTYFNSYKKHTTAGYYMRCDVLPVGAEEEWEDETEEGSEDALAEDPRFADAEGESEEEVSEDDLAGDPRFADAEEETEDAESGRETCALRTDPRFADAEDETGDYPADTDEESWVDDESDYDEESWDEADEETEESDEEDWEDEDETEEEEIPEWEQPLGDYAMSYLDKIRELCEQKGIPLVLIKAPSIEPVWYDNWEKQIDDYAAQYQLPYINYLELVDEIGIDYSTDTYDGGLHMNLYGAEKCADYLGKFLKENFELADMRQDPQISADWAEKEEFYETKKADQLQQISENGKVINP